nr:hypothetical protein [Armatimonadota bacterium]
RFRISPTELEGLERDESVTETLSPPGVGCWSATLCAGAQTSIAIDGSVLRLSLADADRVRLAAPDAEGVYFHTEGETPMRYYVEKDFPCAHLRAAEAQEPAGETFAPPDDFEARKAGIP